MIDHVGWIIGNLGISRKEKIYIIQFVLKMVNSCVNVMWCVKCQVHSLQNEISLAKRRGWRGTGVEMGRGKRCSCRCLPFYFSLILYYRDELLLSVISWWNQSKDDNIHLQMCGGNFGWICFLLVLILLMFHVLRCVLLDMYFTER